MSGSDVLTAEQQISRYLDVADLVIHFETGKLVFITDWTSKEALEYAYDNIREEARRATKGKRRLHA